MSTSNLTAKYRPQTFADVAGQNAIKAILSRAAASDKLAPAYLFSGTRGVGKTTIARIFAKALNCVNAPTAEPCNECSHCRQITSGVAVDVIEIDGASNRGIDDARRLKEDIGYAPVECRYKVFIIDEAHMLTKEAFNALLKTLEEPPPRATFIMATTEPHKFPPTIISRCQHYIYKMLTQQELVDHLSKIMELEGLQFEPAALEIIAKRGAGSVRDSMSLLGQALAMGAEVLKEEEVRSFLGLAGQDVFFQLMEAMHSRNLVSVGLVLRQVLDQGLDLGFFLRELTNCWRNMFLLRQAGKEALPLLGFSGDDAKAWLDWAGKFDPAHIHACWQMTLDGQKKVMTSLEPALALELLLLNLTSLPDLINLESVGMAAPSGGPSSATPPSPMGGQGGPSGGGQQGGGHGGGYSPPGGQRFAPPQQETRPIQQAAPNQQHSPRQAYQPPVTPQNAPAPQQRPSPEPQAVQSSMPPVPPVQASEPEPNLASGPETIGPSEATPVAERAAADPAPVFKPIGPRTWEGFLRYVTEQGEQSGVRAAQLRLNTGEFTGGELLITCGSQMQCAQLSGKQQLSALDALTKTYFGPTVEVKVKAGEVAAHKSDKQLWEEAENHPGVNKVIETFSAQIASVSARKH